MRILLIALLTSKGLIAGGINYLNIGLPHRTFAAKVAVHESANPKSRIVSELPMGFEITPFEQTTVKMTQAGIEAPWYRVKYEFNGQASEGFVWGNWIAKNHTRNREGLIFLYGISRRTTTDNGYSSQIRVVRAGKELARLEIIEGVSFASAATTSLLAGNGFTGVQDILVIGFLPEYCAGKGNRLFIFWTGSKLIFAHSTVEWYDRPTYAIEEHIFPNQKAGKPDHFQVVRRTGRDDNPKSQKVEKFSLRWTGEGLRRMGE